VAFLDADDVWATDFLEKLLAAASRRHAKLAYCGWQNIGKSGLGSQPYVPPDYAQGDLTVSFLHACPWPIHAAMVRRDLIERVGGFSERYFTSLDYDFWLRISAATHDFVLVPEVLAYYRWHGDSQISANRWRQAIDAWRVRRDFVRQHPEIVAHLSRRQLRDLIDGALRSTAYTAFWRRDLATAQVLFRRSLLHGCLRLADLKYMLPSLLPHAVFANIVRWADRSQLKSSNSEH
jgi:GT2 family glycosyltransferase